jgi:hypothetical protein
MLTFQHRQIEISWGCREIRILVVWFNAFKCIIRAPCIAWTWIHPTPTLWLRRCLSLDCSLLCCSIKVLDKFICIICHKRRNFIHIYTIYTCIGCRISNTTRVCVLSCLLEPSLVCHILRITEAKFIFGDLR